MSEVVAVRTNQAVSNKKAAWKAAHADQQWKIFTDLDTQDEAEMLQLAVFLQTLMEHVPGIQANTRQSSRHLEGPDELEDDEGVVQLSSISINGGRQISGDIQDFALPKGNLTPELAEQIVEVYRQGGRLSEKSVQKILRLAYRRLKTAPNTTKLHIGPGERLTVVGDIHGQLPDLLHILDESGMPSATNKYVFNGDFVDRGPHGVEVICILLALNAAMPDWVVLNRGNHEDHAICCVYGFQRECKEKYRNDLIFGMFVEVFRYIPLVTVANDQLLVIHGGLFHDEDVEISVLDEIDRTDYVPKPAVPYPLVLQGLDAEGQRREYLKQLQRDALWSDPQPQNGNAPNPRGAGVVFGPDVTRRFLQRNNLAMVIRSHECVRTGFELPYPGDDEPILATIFSASNYGGSGNEGAYMVFTTNPVPDCTAIGTMFYKTFHYKTADTFRSLEATNQTSLHGLVLKRRAQLYHEFQKVDTEGTGLVTKQQWADIMLAVTEVQIRWTGTLSVIMPDDAIVDDKIDYHKFLQTFHLKMQRSGKDEADLMMDAMYANRAKLEAIFHFFDTDGNGTISREEFRTGCDFLNQTIPADLQLKDYDHILDMMDFDANNEIDINEFFEVFRIIDAKDGSVDGNLDLAKQHK